MILFLHNRYRTLGGEERVARDLLWLVREHLGEDAELLERDSALLGRRAAAVGILGGGLDAAEVARAVRRTRARVVHAHNLNPSFGWRALAAARQAGAKVVLHLHQYRLVCAVGVCFTAGEECTRCHGRNTLPGVVRGCRGSVGEAAVYGAGLALWQRRLAAQVDVFVVPSAFAAARLESLGAPLGRTVVLPPVVREFAERSDAARGGYALFVGRLAPEKGIDVAIDACRRAGIELVVAGDGPLGSRLGRAARFVGRVTDAELGGLRAGAGVAVVPSRSAETFGLAAAEAMASGLPVAASRVGALPELVCPEGLVEPGDPASLAAAIARLRGDRAAGERALARARELVAADAVAPRLGAVYES
ncbi:MAG: glycosyltransferase family 4 protein, partial [Gaiellales bacterium]